MLFARWCLSVVRCGGVNWKQALTLLTLTLAAGCAQKPLPVEVGPQPLHTPLEYAELREAAMREAFVVDEQSGFERFDGETAYVILTSFRFDPDVVVLKSGTITRVRLGNPSLVTHYFGGEAFFDLGAEIVDLMDDQLPANQHHILVPPHGVVDLYLFVKDPGEYRLDCFVPSHRDQGMIGAIIVE